MKQNIVYLTAFTATIFIECILCLYCVVVENEAFRSIKTENMA